MSANLIVALGNPGKEYEFTRHNIGWLCLDQWKDSLNWKNKFKGEYDQKDYFGNKVYFLKPQTYMNLSGESVAPVKNFFKIEIQDILVIHDEIDLPYGCISFKKGGGLAGHNGLKSIASSLGTNSFNRLRMGVGRPAKGSVSNYVLSSFDKEEEIALGPYLVKSIEAIEFYLKSGIDKSANQYNKKNLI
ncbi:MAG: aminoacyl-tRNA hydrolase [Halobacteriovoraceae bacterium]|nr:aminoacyl-tRNA hydrolase [Halobacteriovoraceae bacterium]